VRVQVDDDASPGVLCVSVRVAVFGGGAWGEWRVRSGGGCSGCLTRNTTRNSRPVPYCIRIVLVYSNYLPAGVGW
jgi:hypothetical protein